MRCLWFVALLPACGSPADSKPVDYGLRNQDWDGDGYDRPDDCNDADPEAFPGALERCNGIDDDCNDLIDDGIAVTYYRDRDGDGYGADGTSFEICWHPDGYVEKSGDCDDADAAISPAALEVCDIYGIDEDCNGVANADDPGVTDAHPAYVDADNDGFGVGAPDYVLCFATPGLSITDGDCDDTMAERSPERVEVCDPADVDEDCDGLADDADPEGPWQAVAWFADADGDGFGDPGTGPAWFCDGAPAGWADNPLDCDDAEPRVYSNHYEICSDGLDNDCDGTPDDCGPLPAIDIGTANMVVVGAHGAALGSAVSSTDLDGDGVAELLLGAYQEDSQYGAVHVVSADAVGEYDVADLETARLEGGARLQYFGTPLVGVPDVDADGYGGLAAGNHGPTADDRVWIFEGPLSGAVSQDDADAELRVGDECGWAYDFGDVDGDGAVDHVVTCLAAARRAGTAYVVLGPVSGSVDASDGKLTESSRRESFGFSVATVGDTDGDGTDDVAIAAPDYDSGSGAVFVVLGPDFVGADTDGLTAASGVVYGVDSDLAGWAMAAGDVNGDGHVDLFVTGPTAEIGGKASTGRVYGILGPLDGGELSADLQFVGEDGDDLFGQSIAADGDVSGDGLPDVIIGAISEDHGAAASGETGGAYLFYGPMSEGTRLATDARIRLDGEDDMIPYGDWCGSSVALVPDVSGDGRADVLVGAMNRRTGGLTTGAAYLVMSEGL